MTNYDSVVAQLTGAGLLIDDGLNIGRMMRVKTEDDHREKRGWYSLHEISSNEGERIIVGSFGVWHGGDNNAQKISIEKGALSTEQAEALKKRIADDKRQAAYEKAQAEELAAKEAARVWRQYLPEGESEYLTKKGVKAHGLRFSPGEKNLCVVPMADASGKIWGLERLPDKRSWPKGCAKKGHFHTIGVIRDLVLIAEGYATGASLFEATGLPTVIAFSANNLRPVAEAIKKAHPRARILICADDDYLTAGNPGVTAAEVAALSVNGRVVKPVFAVDRAGQKITDFNDLAALEGLPAVRAQVQAAVGEGGPATSLARGSIPTGGGESSAPRLLDAQDANDRYTLIYGGGGTMFDHVERSLVQKSDVLDICVDRVWGDWKRLPDRRTVHMHEVGFDPGLNDARIKCNLFGGWPELPSPKDHPKAGQHVPAGSVTTGSCKKWLELLHFLCALEQDDEAVLRWVLSWMAYPIQNPGAKMKTSLVFHGPQGAGKNLIFETYMALYGQYGRIVDQSAIEDKFNDWASKKLFLIGDEVVARQELFHQKNKLKSLVTGDWIRINPKNLAAHDERNHANIVFLSNEKQPLVLEPWDRRYTVVWTPDKLDERVYQECAAEMDAGGLHALYNFLSEYDLGDFNPHTKPIVTQAKRDLIEVSLDSTERFVSEWINGDTAHPFGPCGSMDLYRAYRAWCMENGASRPRESNQFLAYFNKAWPKSTGPYHHYEDTYYTGSTKQTRMVCPPEAVLKQKGAEQPTDKTKAQWLTDQLLAFRATLPGAQS